MQIHVTWKINTAEVLGFLRTTTCAIRYELKSQISLRLLWLSAGQCEIQTLLLNVSFVKLFVGFCWMFMDVFCGMPEKTSSIPYGTCRSSSIKLSRHWVASFFIDFIDFILLYVGQFGRPFNVASLASLNLKSSWETSLRSITGWFDTTRPGSWGRALVKSFVERQNLCQLDTINQQPCCFKTNSPIFLVSESASDARLHYFTVRRKHDMKCERCSMIEVDWNSMERPESLQQSWHPGGASGEQGRSDTGRYGPRLINAPLFVWEACRICTGFIRRDKSTVTTGSLSLDQRRSKCTCLPHAERRYEKTWQRKTRHRVKEDRTHGKEMKRMKRYEKIIKDMDTGQIWKDMALRAPVPCR